MVCSRSSKETWWPAWSEVREHGGGDELRVMEAGEGGLLPRVASPVIFKSWPFALR